MLNKDQGRSLAELLGEFAQVRAESLDAVKGLRLSETALSRTGTHPELGEVTLRQLIAAWTVHDLDHIHQITRVMAKLYAGETGPWKKFLRVTTCGEAS